MAKITPWRKGSEAGLVRQKGDAVVRAAPRPLVRRVLKASALLAVAATVLEYTTRPHYATVFMPEAFWLALLDVVFVGYMLYLCRARFPDR